MNKARLIQPPLLRSSLLRSSMVQRRRFARLAVLSPLVPAALLALSACVQLPTEKQGAADLRAQVSFQLQSDRAQGAVVLIDGLEAGRAGDFSEGVAALRVLPGSHRLQVIADGVPLLDERFYIGDGAQRTFTVR